MTNEEIGSIVAATLPESVPPQSRIKGIVREIDQLGRFVVPKELRDALGMEIRTELEIFAIGEEIRIRRYRRKCEFCGEPTENTVLNHRLCPDCVADIAAHNK